MTPHVAETGIIGWNIKPAAELPIWMIPQRTIDFDKFATLEMLAHCFRELGRLCARHRLLPYAHLKVVFNDICLFR